MAECIAVPDFDTVVIVPELDAPVIVAEPSVINIIYSGSGNSAIQEKVIPITTDGAQTVTLTPAINASLGVNLFINGVRQPRTEFTVTNTLLTLPSTLLLMVGDVVTLEYQS
jgi:hypothetical protein